MSKSKNSIFNLLNRWLLKSRYRLVRLSRLEQTLINTFGEDGPFTFVQIGANDGISFDNLYGIVTERECSGLVVEPVPQYFEKLRCIYSAYPHIEAVQTAIHASDSSVTIYVVAPDRTAGLPGWVSGIASLDPEHHKKLGIPSDAISKVAVPCTPLMALFAEHQITMLDYLQIDTEGYDAEILGMLDFSKLKPRIIRYELQHMNDACRADTRDRLEGAGYKLRKDGEDMIAVLVT